MSFHFWVFTDLLQSIKVLIGRVRQWSRFFRGLSFSAPLALGLTLVELGEYFLALVAWLFCGIVLLVIIWPKPGRPHGAILKIGSCFCGLLCLFILVVWTLEKKGSDPWTSFGKTPPSLDERAAEEEKLRRLQLKRRAEKLGQELEDSFAYERVEITKARSGTVKNAYETKYAAAVGEVVEQLKRERVFDFPYAGVVPGYCGNLKTTDIFFEADILYCAGAIQTAAKRLP